MKNEELARRAMYPLVPDQKRTVLWPNGELEEVREAYDHPEEIEMVKDPDHNDDSQNDSDGYHGQGC